VSKEVNGGSTKVKEVIYVVIVDLKGLLRGMERVRGRKGK